MELSPLQLRRYASLLCIVQERLSVLVVVLRVPDGRIIPPRCRGKAPRRQPQHRVEVKPPSLLRQSHFPAGRQAFPLLIGHLQNGGKLGRHKHSTLLPVPLRDGLLQRQSGLRVVSSVLEAAGAQERVHVDSRLLPRFHGIVPVFLAHDTFQLRHSAAAVLADDGAALLAEAAVRGYEGGMAMGTVGVEAGSGSGEKGGKVLDLAAVLKAKGELVGLGENAEEKRVVGGRIEAAENEGKSDAYSEC